MADDKTELFNPKLTEVDPKAKPVLRAVEPIPAIPQTQAQQDATAAARNRELNTTPFNQTFKVENGDKPQTISGKVTKEHDGSFKVESPDGKQYQVTTNKDGHAQKLTEINKETGKPVGEPQRVTAERNGLPTAAEIKKNAEISQPSQTTKHDSHEVKANEQKGANPADAKQPAPEKNPQNEKAHPNSGTERGASPRDGVEPNKSQSDKGLQVAGAQQTELQKSQMRPDNIQASSNLASEKHIEAQREDQKRIADHAAAASRDAESQKKFGESSPQLSSTYEQNKRTAEQVLSRNTFDIPARQTAESIQNKMKDAEIKRMLEIGEKGGGTADGIRGRHTDVIDKMDNATSKAEAAKFLDEKIGLLAAGIATDRGNRGTASDGKSGGGGGGGGSSKGLEEGSKAPGAKPGEGKSSSGERGVGTGSSEGTRDTASGGKDILPTEPTGKLKAQIENVDKMPTQKSQLADMISKYSEGKFAPKGDKESAIMTAFQSVRFDQLKGLGAWLEDKTRNPFEFKMLDGQTQKAVSRIFELVLATATDLAGVRGTHPAEGKQQSANEGIKPNTIRDDKSAGMRADEKLGGKPSNAEQVGIKGMTAALGERTVKLGGSADVPSKDSAAIRSMQGPIDRNIGALKQQDAQGKANDAKTDRPGATQPQTQIDRTAKLDGSKSADARIDGRATQLDPTARLSADAQNSTRKMDDTRRADSTVKIDSNASSNIADRNAPVLGSKSGQSNDSSAMPSDTRKVDGDRIAKTLGGDKIANEELRSQTNQLNDVVKRLVTTYRDENLSATISSHIADSSTSLKALKRKHPPAEIEAVAKDEIIDEDSAKEELAEVMAQTPQMVLPSELSAKQSSDTENSAADLEEQTKLERKSAKFKTKGFTKTGTHRVIKGDTFASIAKKYFETESFAEIIFHYNKIAADISPILGMPGVWLAMPKIGAFLKIPNKTAVWQFKLSSFDYSTYRFCVEQFANASEELAAALGQNWSDQIEKLHENIRIVQSQLEGADSPAESISLQVNASGFWAKIYEYKIYEAETHILKYTVNGTFSKHTKSLPKKQSTEMALNHFRNNYAGLTSDFAKI